MTSAGTSGLDLGGTNLKVAVLEWADDPDRVDDAAMRATSGPSHAERGPDGVAAVMVEAGLAAIEAHGPIATVGIGVPGLFDRETGVIHLFPNFPGPWTGYPLQDRLEAGLGRPVVFINDARAHTLAESRMGAGRGARDDGARDARDRDRWRPDHRREAAPRERAPPARSVTRRSSKTVRMCGCGNRGCAEAARPGEGADRRRRQGPRSRTSSRAAIAGDARCVAAIDQAVRYLGIASRTSSTCWRPTGWWSAAASRRGGRRHPRAAARLRCASTRGCCRPTGSRSCLAELGPLAGAIGAALAGAEARSSLGVRPRRQPAWAAALRARNSSSISAVFVAPHRSAPAAMTSISASSVRTPPAALTLTCGETLARISRRSSSVAPRRREPGRGLDVVGAGALDGVAAADDLVLGQIRVLEDDLHDRPAGVRGPRRPRGCRPRRDRPRPIAASRC